jgi:hypothetical protein
MAAKVIDNLADGAANADDRASRKSRLLKGPEEFRKARVDWPKATKMTKTPGEMHQSRSPGPSGKRAGRFVK